MDTSYLNCMGASLNTGSTRSAGLLNVIRGMSGNSKTLGGTSFVCGVMKSNKT